MILDGSINIASQSNKSRSFTKWIICLSCGQVKFSLIGLVVHKLAGYPVLLIVFIQQWSHFKKCSAQFWVQVVCLLVICSSRQAMSPLVILQNDGLLSLFTDGTASDSVLSNSARFSCANSSESFLEEFISKDTFSMLIKCRGFETACNSASLKMNFLAVFMLCMWAQYVPPGVLTWLIALSLFIYVLFGTPSTHSHCDQNWANVASDWTLGLLEQNQHAQHGLGHGARTLPFTKPSKPGPLLHFRCCLTWPLTSNEDDWDLLQGLKTVDFW